jgi:hypothetical protein
MKPVRLSRHAESYFGARGFTLEEVEEVIRSGEWHLNERGRYECSKDFPYGGEWNGRTYATKQVRPIFVEEIDEIVVITVYTYYF